LLKNINNIILIGYKASGKTTVGRLLANRLDYEFVDTDELFCAQYKNTPAHYSKIHGIDAFRLHEAQIIQNLKYSPSRLIATGGGAVDEIDNIKHLQNLGTLIYLEIDFDKVVERLRIGGYFPSFVTEKHFRRRQQLYQQIAHIQLSIKRETPSQVVDKIIKRLGVVNGQ
jgi:shikimate kinase